MSDTIEKQRQWWNAWDQEFFGDEHLGDEDRRRGRVVLSLLRSLNLSNPEILEIGCANGWFASQLSTHGVVTGIDLADAAVQEARARCPKSTFIAGDVCSMNLPQKFDAVVTLETLAHVHDQKEFCYRLRSVLKPGGHLLMTTQNRFVYDRKKPGIFIERMNQSPDAVLARYTTVKELKCLLSPHFRIRKIFTIQPHGTKGILRFVNSRKLNRAASVVIPQRWLDAAKEKCGLGQTIVVLAEGRLTSQGHPSTV